MAYLLKLYYYGIIIYCHSTKFMKNQKAIIKDLEAKITDKNQKIDVLRTVLKEIRKYKEKKHLQKESSTLENLEGELDLI